MVLRHLMQLLLFCIFDEAKVWHEEGRSPLLKILEKHAIRVHCSSLLHAWVGCLLSVASPPTESECRYLLILSSQWLMLCLWYACQHSPLLWHSHVVNRGTVVQTRKICEHQGARRLGLAYGAKRAYPFPSFVTYVSDGIIPWILRPGTAHGQK